MKLKLIAKVIGNVLMIPFRGKIHKVEGERKEEVKEIIKEYEQTQDEQVLEKLDNALNEEKLFDQKVKESQLNRLKEDKEQTKKSVKKLKKKVSKVKKQIKEKETAKNLFFENCKNNSSYPFKLKNDNRVYLRESETVPLPEAMVEELVKREEKKTFIDNLVNFWKICLINPNPRSRFDLFKYLTKQKMLITQHGYFVGFRRVVSLKTQGGTSSDDKLRLAIDSFANRVRLQKGSLGRFFVVQSELRPDKYKINGYSLVRKDRLKDTDIVLGSVKDLISPLNRKQINNPEEIFTDHRTGTFRIKLGEPVRQSRDLCNEDPGVTCSYGLHVGTPEYVSQNKVLGDQIIAVLINPMHVVSVPYSDAHKMRVCEYYPFMKLTESEMLSLESSDLLQFEHDYMDIEWKELDKILKNLNIPYYEDNSLKPLQSITIENTVESLEKALRDLKEINKDIENLELSGDKIAKDLSLEEIKSIVESRKI